jgi:hypothetical protein
LKHPSQLSDLVPNSDRIGIFKRDNSIILTGCKKEKASDFLLLPGK